MMSPVFTPDKAKLEGQKIDQEIARATSLRNAQLNGVRGRILR